MNRFRWLAKSALTLVLYSGFSAPLPAHELLSDSGIKGPPYQEIYNKLGLLAEQYKGWASVHDYGNTVGGQAMRIIRIGPPPTPGLTTQRPAVLISDAIHGNEYLNIVDRLPEWVLENRDVSPGLTRYFEAGGVLYIVPIMNPDGYARSRRTNNNNTDLNRDFDVIPLNEPNFREPETRLLAEWLDRDLQENNLKLSVTVDYHCCHGSLLFPWGYTTEPLPAATYEKHREIALLMQKYIDPNYAFGTTVNVLGYRPRGTSKDYYHAKYNALAFTFEGKHRVEADNFDKHTLWWDKVLSRVASSF